MKQLFTLILCCSVFALGTAFAEQAPNKKKGQAQGQKQGGGGGNKQAHHPQVHNAGMPPNAQLHKGNLNQANQGNLNKAKVHNAKVQNTNVGAANKTHNNSVQNAKINKTNVHNKTVKNYQLKHNNFHAQQKAQIQTAKFNQNYKIAGAHNWHGQKYVVFQNYHPAWHDHHWYHNHYHDVVLISGGWYFWNAGYWFPAWGYDPGVAYYPYDGPIYVGSNPTPPDQIIADVQATLQQQGYYQGEVDGLLGPQTRAALADYQQAQGLEITAAMDEPTLESLGMA